MTPRTLAGKFLLCQLGVVGLVVVVAGLVSVRQATSQFASSSGDRVLGAAENIAGNPLVKAKSSGSPRAGIEPPIDSVFPLLDDDDGLRDQAQFARSLGFFGKSAIHPRQLEILHQVFTPTDAEIARARDVLAGFDAADGGGSRCRRASSSTCPSPTGLAGYWRSRGFRR